MAGAPTSPAPAKELEPLEPWSRSRFQTSFPVAALTAMTPPMSVPVNTQPSASVGTRLILPAAGPAALRAGPRPGAFVGRVRRLGVRAQMFVGRPAEARPVP